MNYTWIAASDGNFNVATNWQDENGAAGVPGVDDTIILAGSTRCTVNADVTVKNVYTEGYTGRLYPGANRTLTVANGEFILAANAQGAGTGNIKILDSTLRIKSGGSTQRLTVQDSSIILETNITITPVTFIGSSVISGAFQLSVTNIDIDEDAEIEVQSTATLRTAKTGGTISGGRFFGEGSVVLYYNVVSNITTFSGTKFDCDVFLQQSSFIFTGGTEIKRLGNLTNVNMDVAVDNAKIENWDITLASNRTFTFTLDGPLELTGNIATTGTASAINFTQGTDGEIVLTGDADQSIQSPFESVKIVLDKPSGEVDFLGVDCLLESKNSRAPGEDDPRTVSQADLVFSTDTEITLSGSVFVASVDNSGSIIVPVSMVLDTYSYTGQEDSTISGAGTLRVHEGEYESDGTDTISNIIAWSESQPTEPPTLSKLDATNRSVELYIEGTNMADNTFEIQRQNTIKSTNWISLYTGTITNNRYTDTGCLPCTPYNYRAYEINEHGDPSEASNVEIGRTLDILLYQVAVTETTATLSWDTVPTAAAYTIEQSIDETNWTVAYNGTGTVVTSTLSKTDITGLTHSTQYYYRVRAYNANDTGGWSPVKPVKTASKTVGAPVLAHVGSTTTSNKLVIVRPYQMVLEINTAYGQEVAHPFAVADIESINWGDGTTDTTASHTYLTTGTFKVRIKTKAQPVTAFSFFPKTGRNSLIAIKSSAVDFSGITTLANTFYQCQQLNSLPDEFFDAFSNVTDVTNVLRECTRMTALYKDMFLRCPNIARFDGAFADCNRITSDVPELWVSHPTAAHSQCFSGCNNAANYADIPADWK